PHRSRAMRTDPTVEMVALVVPPVPTVTHPRAPPQQASRDRAGAVAPEVVVAASRQRLARRAVPARPAARVTAVNSSSNGSSDTMAKKTRTVFNFTTPGSLQDWPCPAGITQITAWGRGGTGGGSGGGGGAGGGATQAGGGGSAGGPGGSTTMLPVPLAVTPGVVYHVTVGGAGVGGTG